MHLNNETSDGCDNRGTRKQERETVMDQADRGSEYHEERKLRSVDPGALLMVGYITFLACIVIFGSLSEASGAELPEKAFQNGLTFIADSGRIEAPILTQKASIQVSGVLGRTELIQRFVNPTDEWVEAVYVFPLPEKSSVDHLRLVVGERVIEGQIMERKKARKTHEKAKREGRRSGLINQQRPNIFTTRVANIGPGEEIRVEIGYQQRVLQRESTFSLRFPMVVGPRYIPGIPVGQGEKKRDEAPYIQEAGEGWSPDTDQVSDASKITPPVDLVGNKSPEMFIEVDLAAGFEIGNLISRYHDVVREKRANDHYLIRLRGAVSANRDFVLEWRPQSGTKVEASLFSETLDNQQYMLLMLMPPESEKAGQLEVPREMVFVLDISGSMAGSSIVQAKGAVDLALSRLRPTDSFELIVFNDSASAFFGSPVPATAESVGIARQYLQKVEARGGTEMADAVKLALDGSHHHEKLRQVIFLTDGAVGNEKQLFDLINKRLGDSRLFPIGIGSAPNAHFMRQSAILGRGSYTFIGSAREVKEKMDELFTRLESPVLTDLKLALGGAEEGVEIYPNPIPDLYRGEPVVVAFKSDWQTESLTLGGREGKKLWSQRLSTKEFGERPGIAGLWAREKIENLMRQLSLGAQQDAVRQEIVETGLKHHIVSKYTSLIAVDEEVVGPGKKPVTTSTVPTALPAGWKASAVFGGGPQTATSGGLLRIAGMVLLVLAGILFTRMKWKNTV